MTAFDRLHSSLKHHIVNSLGWRELRAFQEQVIPVILAGSHALVIAPTAGGKTEAAIFPVLSRMLTEDWRGQTVLYLCPTKALLNDLHVRLARYSGLVGRSCAVWHGDVTARQRARIGESPPDILLTTPESLELMLVSRKTDHAAIFAAMRVVIVDELHAFAGDDRGWHLLSVLERISRLAGRGLQRIGLSATVGNPEELLKWLVCQSGERAEVICPTGEAAKSAEIQLDFVGSVKNAAVVISRLHRGEKRLVFVDSRAQAEQLGMELAALETKTYVTHSSLSKEERGRAEAAFASESNCVIVATSVMEMGVDVGDLDRVIQIDAPATVASFLQRMGRSGRRAETSRNCLFLATHDQALLQAAALLEIWAEGFVEPVHPTPVAYHVFIQQFLALVLQNEDFASADWPGWIGRVSAFSELGDGRAAAIISDALKNGLLVEDGGKLHLGPTAEAKLGRRHYSELLSVVTSQPLFQVRFGRLEIGQVHPVSFNGNRGRPTTLALGGRGWRLVHLDWQRKIAHVEPAQEAGRSRWLGSSVRLSGRMCTAIRELLETLRQNVMWSRRAAQRIGELRMEMSECCYAGGSVIAPTPSALEWWTFAGLAANQTLVQYLQPHIAEGLQADNLCLKLPADLPLERLKEVIDISRDLKAGPSWNLERPAADILKFAELLPEGLMHELILSRLSDIPRAREVLRSPLRVIDRG